MRDKRLDRDFMLLENKTAEQSVEQQSAGGRLGELAIERCQRGSQRFLYSRASTLNGLHARRLSPVDPVANFFFEAF